jgi:hypothetical protein
MKINSKLKGEFVKAKSLSAVAAIICISIGLSACSTAKTANPTGWSASIYQSASSTKVGCLPDEITITDLDHHGGFSRARDWFATCKGKKYFCSGVNDGYGGTTNVSCMDRDANNAVTVETPAQKNQ